MKRIRSFSEGALFALLIILVGGLIAVILTAPKPAKAQTNFGTLPEFIGTTSPSVAITQKTINKAIKITGLTTGLCLSLDANNLLTTTACGSGGAGGAATTSFAATYPVQVTSNSANITYSLAFGTTTQNFWNAYNNFSSLFATSASSTNATTTGSQYFTGITASRPLYVDSTGKLTSAGTGTSGNCVNWGANNTFGDAGAACGSGSGGAFPFTPATNYAVNTSATSTALWAKAGLYASSTSGFDQINVGSSTTGTMSTSTFYGNLSVANGGFSSGAAGTGGYLWHDYKNANPWFGIYDAANVKYYGIAKQLPSPTASDGVSTSVLGGYYYGLGIGGATNSGLNPIFGVLNSSQSANGMGNVAFTIYANNTIQDFYNVIDDGAGRVGIGTTTPFAAFSIGAKSNGTINTSLFNIGSSTASATTSLFNISNTGALTTSLGTGCVTSTSGLLSAGSACGTVTSVTATAPLFSSGGATPNITWAGLATTSALTQGQLLYNTTGGSGVASVATSTLTVSGPFTYPTISVVGSNGAIAYTGLATTSQPSSSNLLVSNGGAGVYGVATSSETCTSPLSCPAHAVLTGGGAITIQAASASQNGYLAQGDYSLLHTATTTFSSPLTYTNSTNAVTCATCATFGYPFTGLAGFNSTSTTLIATGGLFASSTVTFANSGDIGLNWKGGTGSLGIGTTTPYAQLTVLATSTTGTGSALNLFAIASTTGGTSTTTLFSISNVGNVMIGTTSPGFAGNNYALSISNVIKGLGGLLIHTATNVTNALAIFNAAGTNVFSVDTTATNPHLSVGSTTPWGTLVASGDGTNPIAAFSTTTNQGLPNWSLDKLGHTVTSGVTPTSLNTNCTNVVGNDNNFRTITATSITTCTITFANSWGTNAPICIANEESGGVTTVEASSTPTTVVLDIASALTSKSVAVVCRGYQ